MNSKMFMQCDPAHPQLPHAAPKLRMSPSCARMMAYPRSAQSQGERNGCPMEEPRPPVDLPG